MTTLTDAPVTTAPADIAALLRAGGDGVAFRDATGTVLTHAALLAQLDTALDGLRALGLRSGHRLGLLLPPAPLTAVLTLALSERIGVLPLNPAWTPAELRALVAEAGVDALLLPGPAGELADLPHLVMTGAQPTGASLPAPKGDRGAGLVLLTSGSTGTPKRVPLTAGQLWRSARTIADTLRLGPQDRALHVLPMFHIGGLVDLVLAPLLAGGQVVLAQGPTPDAIATAVQAGGATWLQLVPTMLHRCLKELDPRALRQLGQGLRFVRSVSSDLTPDRQAAAEDALGGVPILQMYGMTEATGQITSNPLPPGERRAGTVGTVAGCAVRLLDETGSVVPVGAVGEICLHGPTVTAGYEDTPRAGHWHGDWLRSGDLGRFDAAGHLVLVGRVKEMINRGGEKISPLEVERAALRLPGVAEAVAFALPHPTLGEQVGLAVAATPGADLDPDAILRALAVDLAEYKLPRRVALRAALPRLGSGKPDRRRLQREEVEQAAPAPVAYTGLAARLAAIWAEVLERPTPPRPEDDFFDQGGDSLSGVTLILRIEQDLGLRIEGNLLFEAPRFGDLLARLETLPSTPPAAEVRTLRHVRQQIAAWRGQPHRKGGLILGLGTVGTGAPLFFCTQQEQETMAVRAILHPSRPLYALRSLHGLSWWSPDDARALALRYADEICEIRPDGPLALGGFCNGGVVAALVADALRDRGRQVALFVAIDHWFAAPTDYPVMQVWTDSPRYSPSWVLADPDRALRVLHPAGALAVPVPGDHGGAMTPDHLAPLSAPLEAALSDLSLPLTAEDGPDFAQRQQAARGALRLRAPLLWRQGQAVTLRVTLRNDSAQDWPATAQGGPQVVARLFSRGIPRKPPVIGRAGLPQGLAAGQSVTLSLTVTPPASGWGLMVVQMQDDAVGPFGPVLRRPVWMRAG